MSDYVVRPAVLGDAEAIAKIYVRAWRFAYKGIVPQEYLDSLSEDKYLKRIKDKEGPDEFVFELDGNVVGLARLIDCRDKCAEGCAEVQTIYFLPEHTSKGYGQHLLNSLKEIAFSKGYRDMIIWVLTENARARRAYEKAGFSRDKSRLITIAGKDLKESRYTIRL